VDLNIYTEADAEKAAVTVKNDPASAADIANPDKDTKSGETLTKDDVYGRVLKYVPAPLIGLYLMATNLVISQADEGEEPSEETLWVILVVALIAIIGFLVKREVKRVSQLVLSAVAFLAVASASPGPFQQIDDWNELWGTLALIGAAALLIVFKPKALPEE
jgi:hypothetical protein